MVSLTTRIPQGVFTAFLLWTLISATLGCGEKTGVAIRLPDTQSPGSDSTIVPAASYDTTSHSTDTGTATETAEGSSESHFDSESESAFHPLSDSTSYSVSDSGTFDTDSASTGTVDTETMNLEYALEGHWPLDEQSGTEATDISGNSLNGTVTLTGDASTWSPADGHIGGSLYCHNDSSGNGGYVQLPNAIGSVPYSIPRNGEAYTLSAWARIRSVPPDTGQSQNQYAYGIVIKPGRHTGIWYGNDQRFHGTHHFAVSDTDDELIDVSSYVSVPDNTFHHVAVVFNPDNLSYALFVDGAEMETASYDSDRLPYGFPIDSNWRFGVAVPNVSAWGMYGDLNIDDIRIYSRALSALEIRALAAL